MRYHRIMDSRIEITASEEHFKMRLDDFLFGRFNGLSKMYLRELVKTQRCEVNGRSENIGYKLRPNDLVEIFVDTTRETAMRPENVPLDIIFEDSDLIVVNKPAGMLVHPTHRDKNGTLLNALAYHVNKAALDLRALPVDVRKSSAFPDRMAQNDRGYAAARGQSLQDSGVEADGEAELLRKSSGIAAPFIRPGLIHRLDKQTSGLLVVAKTARAHRILAEHFRRKLVNKRYLAVVEGIVDDDEGSVIMPIGRYADRKLWDVKADGKHAETRYWVKERHADRTLLELEPVTGRTNQLRIHCASIGHPIVGDTARGGREFERLCLHAYRLAFRHPFTSEDLKFENDQCSFPGP